MVKSSNEVPEAERAKLMALQARYRRLLAMLPTDPNELAELDAAGLDARLDDIELITAEMADINAAERAILDGLARH